MAILIDGSWLLQDIAKQTFKYGAGVLPKMKTAVTEAQAHMHMIHKDTKHPDEAWKLLAAAALSRLPMCDAPDAEGIVQLQIVDLSVVRSP